MKKLVIFLFIVVLGVLMFATCPDKKDHQEAIKAVVSSYLEEEMSSLPSGIEEVVDKVGLPVAGTVLDVVMKNKLKINKELPTKNQKRVLVGTIWDFRVP